jgi:hypothetical protein
MLSPVPDQALSHGPADLVELGLGQEVDGLVRELTPEINGVWVG